MGQNRNTIKVSPAVCKCCDVIIYLKGTLFGARFARFERETRFKRAPAGGTARPRAAPASLPQLAGGPVCQPIGPSPRRGSAVGSILPRCAGGGAARGRGAGRGAGAMADAATRAAVHREFAAAGFSLSMGALGAIAEAAGSWDDPDALIEQVLESVTALCEEAGTNIVSPEAAVKALHTASAAAPTETAAATADADGTAVEPVAVISAFAGPRLTYDLALRRFREMGDPGTLLGSPEAKTAAFRDRLYLLQERLSLLPGLSKPVLAGPSARSLGPGGGGQSAGNDIVPIASLLGSGMGVVRCIMGALVQLREDTFSLEDTSGTVTIDMRRAVHLGGVFTECCIVLAKGVMRPSDGVFEVHELASPPLVTKAEAARAGHAAMGGAAAATAAGDEEHLRRLEQAATGDMLVLMSDVHLDDPATMESLQKVLSGFEASTADGMAPPTMFVLMGDFLSGDGGEWAGGGAASRQSAGAEGGSGGSTAARVATLSRKLSELGELIEEHPQICEHSLFLLVPGPNDPGPAGSALPRPHLPEYVTEKLTKQGKCRVSFGSNPCRVRFYTQEIVLYRSNIAMKMRRLALAPPTEPEEGGMFAVMATTLLGQAHLSPVPLAAQAVYWDFDSAMRLYDAPDVLVLADSSAQATVTCGDTQAVNPGSFSADGSFVVYLPAERSVQPSEVPS